MQRLARGLLGARTAEIKGAIACVEFDEASVRSLGQSIGGRVHGFRDALDQSTPMLLLIVGLKDEPGRKLLDETKALL